MSEHDVSQLDPDQELQGAVSDEEEVLDGVPVLAGATRILPAQASPDPLALERRAPTVIPAVQAAAVAAGGFVAGAAVAGLVHRRKRRSSLIAKPRRGRRGAGRVSAGSRVEGRAGELLQIVGSRSLLLDVHLLGGSGADR